MTVYGEFVLFIVLVDSLKLGKWTSLELKSDTFHNVDDLKYKAHSTNDCPLSLVNGM